MQKRRRGRGVERGRIWCRVVGVHVHNKTNQHDDSPPMTPVRFSKTSLLAAPSSDDIKAVVQASKTKSVCQGGGTPLRPSRRRAPPPSSAVLTALRRAMSRDRQIQN